MQQEKENSNKVKAETYFKNRWKAHIKLKPEGALDCLFNSELIDGKFYQISKLNIDGEPVKDDLLFLVDIYNIIPYREFKQ